MLNIVLVVSRESFIEEKIYLGNIFREHFIEGKLE